MPNRSTLVVWHRANAFPVAVHRAAQAFPVRGAPGLKAQLLRSVGSIAAHIAEGAGHETNTQGSHFVTHPVHSFPPSGRSPPHRLPHRAQLRRARRPALRRVSPRRRADHHERRPPRLPPRRLLQHRLRPPGRQRARGPPQRARAARSRRAAAPGDGRAVHRAYRPRARHGVRVLSRAAAPGHAPRLRKRRAVALAHRRRRTARAAAPIAVHAHPAHRHRSDYRRRRPSRSVYSAHLGTLAEITPRARREPLGTSWPMPCAIRTP
jgi:hypothetical protein